MSTIRSDLVVGVKDYASGPLRSLSGVFGRFRHSTRGLHNIGMGMGGLALRLGALGAGYLGVTRGAEATVGAARKQQAALTEIGIKAEMTRGQLTGLQKRMVALGPSVNQTTDDLLAGVDTMLTMGTAAGDAEAALPAIAKTATATGAAMSDLSAASVSAMQNLKVAPREVQRMLEGMTYAGNAGAFEMRDMATYFPQLTAQAQALGIKGVDGVNDLAAALQIARRGAGDASSAANNLGEFMGKIVMPTTVKNFKKFGVDVTKELQRANKLGISPIEHFIQLIDKKTKGGKADLVTQIFGDKQALNFIRPMLTDFKDYIRIRDGAMGANGVVADAYSQRMQDADQKIKSLRISVGNLGTAVGNKVNDPLGDAAQHLADLLNTTDQRATLFDRLKADIDGLMSGLGVDKTDLSARLKSIEEFFFGVKDASKAADEIGRNFHTWQGIGKSLREADFGNLFSPTTILSLMGGGLALRGLGGGVRALPLGGPLRLMLLAGGIGALAMSGDKMSAVDWAGLAIGLTAFAGGLGKLWPYLGLISLASAIQTYGPDVVKKARKPKAGEPLDWLGLDPTETREERLDRLNQRPERSGPTTRGRSQNQAERDHVLDGFLNLPTPTARPDDIFQKMLDGMKPGSGKDGVSVAPALRNMTNGSDAASGSSGKDGVAVRTLPPITGTVTTQPSGVQQVVVTNPQRPNINMPITVYMQGNDPNAAANAIADKVRATVSGSFSDGGIGSN